MRASPKFKTREAKALDSPQSLARWSCNETLRQQVGNQKADDLLKSLCRPSKAKAACEGHLPARPISHGRRPLLTSRVIQHATPEISTCSRTHVLTNRSQLRAGFWGELPKPNQPAKKLFRHDLCFTQNEGLVLVVVHIWVFDWNEMHCFARLGQNVSSAHRERVILRCRDRPTRRISWGVSEIGWTL